MQQPAPFLILDDDDVFAQTLARALTRRGFAPQIAHTGGEALSLARQTPFAYVTVDLHLAASDRGLMPHGAPIPACTGSPRCARRCPRRACWY